MQRNEDVIQVQRAAGAAHQAVPVAPVSSIACTTAAFARLARDLLRAGKAVRFEARGGSMAPLVRDGDVVLVRPVDGSSVRFGDMVLCSSEAGRVLVHRVIGRKVKREGRWFTVQGDALSRPDGEIPEMRVCGRVVAIQRGAVHIDVQRPLMRMLAWAAALRSRWSLGRGDQLRLIKRLLKKAPVLCTYLA